MMSGSTLPDLDTLIEDCEALERRLSIEERTGELAPLLRFEPNLDEPIHSWFRFKEGFSRNLVSLLLSEFAPRRRSIAFLDPFAGVATTLLEAEFTLRELGARSLLLRGIEVNPWIHFVGKTKMAWNEYRAAQMIRDGDVAMNGVRLPRAPSIPRLSTFMRPEFVLPSALQELVTLRDKVKLVTSGRREGRLLLLGIAAATDSVFNLRKDGRALRFTPKPLLGSVLPEVSRKWDRMAEDLQHLERRRLPIDYLIERGDGRRVDALHGGRKFHVIMFSPPYLNNIDYTEVYKLELWLLGFVKSPGEMLSQRRRTFRSHPSCAFPEYEDAEETEVKRILGRRFMRLLLYAGEGANWRRRLFAQYFADMLRTLRGCARTLADDGCIVMVIGNSVHGTSQRPIPVAVDLWCSKLAGAAGLNVRKIIIGRRFVRRAFESRFMRESVIIMSKR